MKNVLIVTLGNYGRGETITEAYDNIKSSGARSDMAAVLYIGNEELRFLNLLQIEGRVRTTVSFKRLSHLKGAKLL